MRNATIEIKQRYLRILLNIRNNVYASNQEQLKKDLITLKALAIYVSAPNQNIQNMEKILVRKYQNRSVN